MANNLLFGRFADVASWSVKQIAVASIAELRLVIAADYPAVAEALAGSDANVVMNQETI